MFVSRSENWSLGNSNSFQIEIVEGYWGGVKTDDIRGLLENVAKCILQYFDEPCPARIFVECNPNRPIPEVNCRYAATGEYIVTLTTQDFSVWSYEFAHECCHILSRHERLHALPNKWFHEAVCELASIFTMRQMAGGPSMSTWQDYASKCLNYAEWLVTRHDFQLPANTNLPDWFRANEQSLRANPYQRDKNGIVALRLLPLIERDPKYWQSVCFLPDSLESFENFLSEWRKDCPEQQRPFISNIARLFDFSLKQTLT